MILLEELEKDGKRQEKEMNKNKTMGGRNIPSGISKR